MRTLAEVLQRRARDTPDRRAFVCLQKERDAETGFTYGELDRAARHVANRLRSLDAASERVLLLYPHGLDFIAALFGCFYAGAVAVPVLPAARPGQSRDRLRGILADAVPRFALTNDADAAALSGAPIHITVMQNLKAVAEGTPEPWTAPSIDPHAICMLQYTSGSTGTPNGVMLSHANIMRNEAMICERFEHTPDSVVVSWLPVYHDMGLIGMLFQPLYVGNPCIFMSPVTFMQRPIRWLQAISRYRATTSGGPNFAYEMCVDRIKTDDCTGLDLSSLEIAYSGAEPVRADTMRRFSERFAACGFRPEAFYPCYGLAEATLLVTGGRKLSPWRLRTVDAVALESDHRAVAVREDGHPRTLVGCGTSPACQSVRIVHPETGEELEEGHVGEIWVAGPCVAGGYWKREHQSRATFEARVQGDPETPFLRTGDLGFLDGRELYVTGRIKDVLIIRGRNHYPQDIEATAENSHPALLPAGSVAMLVPGAADERLVLVHEVRRQYVATPDTIGIAAAVRQRVAREHGLQIAGLVLLRPGTLPRTTSGKLRRQECRRLLMSSAMPVLAEHVLGGPPSPA
jgi:acyl-CoA synthetase (AMP-forming)/AMP-acid ligase II